MKINADLIEKSLINKITACDNRYSAAAAYLEEKLYYEEWDLVSNTAQDLKAINLERTVYIANLTEIRYAKKVYSGEGEDPLPSSNLQFLHDEE